MKTGKIRIVVNPTAGSGKAKTVARTLVQIISHISLYDFDITFTSGRNDAIDITRKAITDGATMIVAVGGDGTINEVVNGFFEDGNQLNPSCELGIINCGTGKGLSFKTKDNDKSSLDRQIGLIFEPGYIKMDLGRVTYRDNTDKTVSRLFINECQTGIGSKVVSIVGKYAKFFWGKYAFGFMATLQAFTLKSQLLEIGYDDDSFKPFTLLGLVVGNGPECGGGMRLTPDADLTDGLFDVLSIDDMNVAQRLLNLSKVYSGNHLLSPHFSVKRCRKLKIRSETKLSLEADGELLGFSPFDIEIIPAAIRIKA
jgi:diacylglycerol kinase (ATP)